MGAFGVHTWGEYFARQLAHELREEQQRVARILSRMERTQELIRKDDVSNRVGEPLGCPACKARYDLGDYCLVCDVELVGEAWIDLVEPMPRREDSRADRLMLFGAFHVAAFATCFLLTSAFLLMNPHPQLPEIGAGHDEPVRTVLVKHVPAYQRIAYAEEGRVVTPRLRVELVPDPAGPGPELHLLAPGGELNSALDCHAGNGATSPEGLDWGVPRTPADDPDAWRDPGDAGGEGVRILAPSPGIYTVALVVPEDDSAASPRAQVRVYVDGELALDRSWTAPTAGQSRSACQIEFPRGDLTLL
jgi:hypothetical protein